MNKSDFSSLAIVRFFGKKLTHFYRLFFMESIIQKALRLILDKFGAEYDCIMVSEENGHYRANIETAHAPRLIGKNGATLNSLQTLLKNILWAQNQENIFVSVDVDNYQKSHEDQIIQKAQKYIDMMEENNLAEIKLPPMKAFYRRVVHLWIVANHPNLGTDSIGEGRDRAIKVFHK